ncbi:MAG: hypothetical protein B655_1481 [Methanobacterium sp. Maddingley MBC34]|nr:MAG: hypothetical protein B655_1481 [Methanobacterium sp. Maddingley MBC34]
MIIIIRIIKLNKGDSSKVSANLNRLGLMIRMNPRDTKKSSIIMEEILNGRRIQTHGPDRP